MAIRVVIADDHEAVRLGLRGLLDKSDVKIVAEAETGEQAVRLVKQHEPHVVLLDVRMPEPDGLHALGRLKLEQPELRVLMFSAYENPMFIARCVALGAAGYLLKSASRQEIVDAIHKAAAGEDVWTNEQMRFASSALATPRHGVQVEVSLTRREGEVLKEVSEGHTNKQIAQQLEISTETVKEHIRTILHKIGVADRTQAAVWAVRKQLV